MTEYVSKEKIVTKNNPEGFYMLTLRKVPGINCDYKISFKNNNTYKDFSRAIMDIIYVSAGYSYVENREGGGTIIIHLNSDEPASKYVMKIQPTEWFDKNIDKLTNNLKKQASAFEKRVRTQREIEGIKEAIIDGENLSQAICELIKGHSKDMTMEELSKIQSTIYLEILKKQNKIGNDNNLKGK